MKNQGKVCSVDGCGLPAKAKGFCRRCYKRERYRGNVLREGFSAAPWMVGRAKPGEGKKKRHVKPELRYFGPIRLGDRFGMSGLWVFDTSPCGNLVMYVDNDRDPYGKLMSEAHVRALGLTQENPEGRVVRSAIAMSPATFRARPS